MWPRKAQWPLYISAGRKENEAGERLSLPLTGPPGRCTHLSAHTPSTEPAQRPHLVEGGWTREWYSEQPLGQQNILLLPEERHPWGSKSLCRSWRLGRSQHCWEAGLRNWSGTLVARGAGSIAMVTLMAASTTQSQKKKKNTRNTGDVMPCSPQPFEISTVMSPRFQVKGVKSTSRCYSTLSE